jgi:hypothetical protein
MIRVDKLLIKCINIISLFIQHVPKRMPVLLSIKRQQQAHASTVTVNTNHAASQQIHLRNHTKPARVERATAHQGLGFRLAGTPACAAGSPVGSGDPRQRSSARRPPTPAASLLSSSLRQPARGDHSAGSPRAAGDPACLHTRLGVQAPRRSFARRAGPGRRDSARGSSADRDRCFQVGPTETRLVTPISERSESGRRPARGSPPPARGGGEEGAWNAFDPGRAPSPRADGWAVVPA